MRNNQMLILPISLKIDSFTKMFRRHTTIHGCATHFLGKLTIFTVNLVRQNSINRKSLLIAAENLKNALKFLLFDMRTQVAVPLNYPDLKYQMDEYRIISKTIFCH